MRRHKRQRQRARSRQKTKMRGGARQRVSDKISVLRHENVPRDQAIAMSLSMERAGRLRPGGKYVRAKKKRSRSRH